MQATVQTVEMMGGTAVLGPVSSALDMVRLVRAGLPVRAAEYVLATGWLTPTEMDRVVLPRKTLYNRRKHGALTAEQSDRLVRVARILAAAADTFEEDARAQDWLRRPSPMLGGEKPLDLLDTDEGARTVENVLGRIAYGIFA